MSVINHEKLANHISGWIKNYAEKSGIKTLILGLSGGIDSGLVALLCKQTNMPLLCVNMPCHSSSTAFDRASAFAKDYSIPLVKVDLSSAHEHIMGQAKELVHPNFNPENRIAVGGLRSCLRAPTLSFYANATRGLIVGTGNRSEDNITRYFQKYGDGCVDLAPIADLFKSEVYELFAYVADKMGDDGHHGHAVRVGMDPSAQAIYDAKPTADLWGPDSGQEDEKELGISYDEIEWADREDMRTTEDIGKAYTSVPRPGIVKRAADPAKHPAWLGYSGRQREVIAKLHQMEKITRHKYNPALPICEVRDPKLGLVR